MWPKIKSQRRFPFSIKYLDYIWLHEYHCSALITITGIYYRFDTALLNPVMTRITRISWKLKSLRHVNSCKFSAEPLFQEFAPPPPPERLRPTLQLKIKAKSSWNGLRWTPPPPQKRLRPTLQLKIKAKSSWNGLRWTPPPQKRLRPTLQLKIKAKSSWNGLRWPPQKRLRPTLQLKIKAKSSWNGLRWTPPPPRKD